MRIAVLDDYQGAFRSCPSYPRLKDHEVVVFHDREVDPLNYAVRLKDADAVLLTQQRSAFPRALIRQLPRLKLIAQTGGHTDHIDVAACSQQGIVIAAGGGGSSHPTAELTWALILASVRHIPHEVEQLKHGLWLTTIGTGLYGKTLGVYAFGRIGRLVAEVGRAFGMSVICWGREASQARARDAGFEVCASRALFFESADIITLHVQLNSETRGLVTAADLARMKTTALLVNTSRARLIADGALVDALERGRPGFAAVDVYESEPVTSGDHPLLKMPNVLCTPHLGYVEMTTMESYYRIAIDGIIAFAAGQPVNVLNPEALLAR